MSEAALMLVAGKPALNGQTGTGTGAEGVRAQAAQGAEGETTGADNVFGGLLLQVLDSAGSAESPQALLLPESATSGDTGNGKNLPQDSPLVAWSALMMWEDLPQGQGNFAQAILKGESGALTGQASGPASGNANMTLLSGQGNLLMRQTTGAEAMHSMLAEQQHNDELLNQQNLFKLLTEQSSASGQRAGDLRQSSSLLFAAESSDPALAPLTGSASQSASSGQFNQLLAGLGGLNAAGQGRADVPLPPMTVAPQHPGWSNGLGERIQWMVGQNMQQAEIRLEPPELGTLELKITLNRDNQANLTVMAANSQVRDAVEAATPRLREMFGDIGLELGDVNVSQESFAQQQQTGDESGPGEQASIAGRQAGAVESEQEESQLTGESSLLNANGLLDTYA